ncbi:MAG TPA: hypothetical protein VHP63_07830 [candidate division Zixibacteria bacterium]|nr:hypothetical protein [candidate division Zixibacteria bacterium]
MLEGKFQRGFSFERLTSTTEPKVRKDDNGFYMMTLSENTKVYFDDFYRFLERVFERASIERSLLDQKIADTPLDHNETLAYYRARGVIIDQIKRGVLRFYTDGSTFGVIMTPWCFGTVMLEKIEAYRERLSRGEVEDSNVPEYPFYVVQYIDEIYKITLLELFDFPEQAFQMRWQYSELLKKYSTILTSITGSLRSVLDSIRNKTA